MKLFLKLFISSSGMFFSPLSVYLLQITLKFYGSNIYYNAIVSKVINQFKRDDVFHYLCIYSKIYRSSLAVTFVIICSKLIYQFKSDVFSHCLHTYLKLHRLDSISNGNISDLFVPLDRGTQCSKKALRVSHRFVRRHSLETRDKMCLAKSFAEGFRELDPFTMIRVYL